MQWKHRVLTTALPGESQFLKTVDQLLLVGKIMAILASQGVRQTLWGLTGVWIQSAGSANSTIR